MVDSVSGIGGEPLEVDNWQMDIVLGGSQKCLSASPGLTFLSISKEAWDIILNRKTPIGSFYCNLALWKNWYEEKWFPYTQPISHIYSLNSAIDRLLEEGNYIERHEKISNAVRYAIVESGLELYPVEGFSNTVTTVLIPDGITFADIFNHMVEKHNIMIAGAFDYLKDKVFRIGHMGENCHEEKIYITLKALDETFKNYGININGSIHKHFIEAM